MDFNRMEAQLLLHEGERLRSYKDTTGNWTVFVGYNLTARGTGFLQDVCDRPFPGFYESVTGTRKESRLVLQADIRRLHAAIPLRFTEYPKLDEVRQRVVLDMAFNLGTRALDFRRARAAVAQRDYTRAAAEMLNSKWARQVGSRADRLATMLRTGQDYVA